MRLRGTALWEKIAWPAADVDHAVAALCHALVEEASSAGPQSAPGRSLSAVDIPTVARLLGLRAEETEVASRDLESFVRHARGTLVRVPGPEGFILAVLSVRLGRVSLLRSDGRRTRVSVAALVTALRAALSAEGSPGTADWLDEARIGGRRRRRAERWLVDNELDARGAVRAWYLDPGEEAGWRHHFRDLAWGKRLIRVLMVHAFAYILWIPAWGLLAWMAFGDRIHSGWWWAWILICLTMFPLRAEAMLSAQLLATDLIARVRQRLLSASLRLDPDRVRHLGIGQMLGVALEVSEVNGFLQTGALVALTTLVEIGVLFFLLSVTAGVALGLSLLVCVLLVLGLAWLYYRRCAAWIAVRMELTHGDVERMVGHRTRILQEDHTARHLDEDRALDRYLAASRRMDQVYVLLRDVVPRGWFVLSFAMLLAALAAQTSSATALLGGAVGAILGWKSLRALATALAEAAQAVVGWERVRVFLDARAEQEHAGDPSLVPSAPPMRNDARSPVGVLETRGVEFRYPGRPRPVLQDVSLRIEERDRVRLEGVSGGGKSTLASLLSQARGPSSGLVLLQGADVGTVGSSAWRRRVVMVPQFHDNHLLMGPFAFNVLMGRAWPPTAADIHDAEEICRALGLGPLIERMPGGMLQIVGETGWQLSHGERTRLFMARALAQRPDVLILDETLAALDPESLRLASGYLERQEAAVVMIAHP